MRVLQNWQSAFLSTAVLVTLSIFPRVRGSSFCPPAMGHKDTLEMATRAYSTAASPRTSTGPRPEGRHPIAWPGHRRCSLRGAGAGSDFRTQPTR
ncbi:MULTISPECIES: DUF6766 family protein [Ensifer]|uniref:DUF6766 family protein n=1 Tax=Ensifer TaxID=106591 RepID=UPI003002C443